MLKETGWRVKAEIRKSGYQVVGIREAGYQEALSFTINDL
jgi:hypothetical protein